MSACSEAMLTIAPPFAAFIAGRTARAASQADLRSTAKTFRPALLTRPLTGPNILAPASSARSISEARRTSPAVNETRLSAAGAARSSRPADSSRSMIETRAPSASALAAIAAPMPRAPPVTSTWRPSMRPATGAFPCSPSGQRLAANPPFDQRLQDDRDHDDESEGELGVEGVDARRDNAGVDRADDVGGDERADDRSRPAEHRRAAEEDGGDGVEQEAVAGGRPEIIAVNRGHEPGEDGGHPDQDESARLHGHRVDAHQPRAGRIVADQEHMRAEAGPVEQDPEDDEQDDHP